MTIFHKVSKKTEIQHKIPASRPKTAESNMKVKWIKQTFSSKESNAKLEKNKGNNLWQSIEIDKNFTKILSKKLATPKIKTGRNLERSKWGQKIEKAGLWEFQVFPKFVYYRYNFHTCKNKGTDISNNSSTNF